MEREEGKGRERERGVLRVQMDPAFYFSEKGMKRFILSAAT